MSDRGSCQPAEPFRRRSRRAPRKTGSERGCPLPSGEARESYQLGFMSQVSKLEGENQTIANRLCESPDYMLGVPGGHGRPGALHDRFAGFLTIRIAAIL